jgi:16S rRNA (guanine966-N2)-methyltransferase
MRIIAGQFGGRQIQSPHSQKTHPMSQKGRGGLFSVLGDITGLRVLDAFAGSGALGLEAVSRGAALVVAIDNDRQAQATIQANIGNLKVESKIDLVKSSVSAWSNKNPKVNFDLILVDPPYDKLPPSVVLLEKHLVSNGILVLSWPGNLESLEIANLKVVALKQYGDSQLVFYQKTG